MRRNVPIFAANFLKSRLDRTTAGQAWTAKSRPLHPAAFFRAGHSAFTGAKSQASPSPDRIRARLADRCRNAEDVHYYCQYKSLSRWRDGPSLGSFEFEAVAGGGDAFELCHFLIHFVKVRSDAFDAAV